MTKWMQQVVIFSLLLLVPSIPSYAFLSSVKGAGMAVTGIAYPQDAETGAYNPATISWVGSRIDIGVSPIRTHGQTTIRGNAVAPLNGTFNAYEKNWVFNPHFGITKEFCGCSKPITFGFVLYNGADLAYTKYKKAFPLLGTSPTRLSYYQEVLAPMMSVKLNDCHSFGVAFNIFTQRLHVNGLERFANPVASVQPNHVTNTGAAVAMGYGLQFGWLGQFWDRVKLGLTFAPQTKIYPFNKYEGFLAQRGHLNAPEKWGGGISVNVTPCLVTAFDVVWERWSHIRALHNPLALNIPPISPGPKLGSDDGSGFGWRDRTYYRVGLDYAYNCALNLRLGYRFAKGTVPPSQTAVNLLINETIEQFVTAGFTYRFWCNFELSGYYAHGFEHTVRGKNSIPVILGGGNVDITQGRDAFGFSLGYLY